MSLDDELKDLRDRMSQMSDEELLRIVEVDYDDYRKEAITRLRGQCAVSELQQDYAFRVALRGQGVDDFVF